jgi:HSP20 family protein
MSTIRFNPMWEMQNMLKEMNKYVRDNISQENRPRIEIGDFKPRIDVIEDENSLYFEAELPGVSKDDVKVSVNDDNILTIKGNKKFDRKDEVTSCCRNERSFGEFVRSFQLPDIVDSEKISANYQNGVLTLTVPKMEPVKPKEKEVAIS